MENNLENAKSFVESYPSKLFIDNYADPFIHKMMVAYAAPFQAEIEQLNESLTVMLRKNTELGSELTQLRAEMDRVKGQWVSVDERLPEPCQRIIVQKHNGLVCEMWINSDKQFMYSASNQTNQITHWHPLPSPPQIIQAQDNEKI